MTRFVLDEVLDEVLDAAPLLDTAAIAAQAGLPLLEDTAPGAPGARVARWTPRDQPTIELWPRADWWPYDELVLPVFVPPGQGGRLTLTIEMGTQTPGIEGPDRHWLFYPLGTAARTPAHGWVELPFPRENFRVYGIPDAWRTVKQLTFELTGVEHLLLGPLSLRRRRRAAGPRLTDAALFRDQLHLARPGLEDVRRAAEGGDFAAAGRALCDYFRARREPRHFYGRPKGGPVDLENARRILQHVICGQQLGAEIDWYANPIGYVGWMNELNRHAFLRDLVQAYLATGDDAYVAELDALLASWIAANPSPIGNNGGFYPAWQTLSTAVRVYGSWLEVFFATLPSAAFRDETRVAMLKALYHHAEHLLAYGQVGSANWMIAESQAIALVGVLFPELKRSAVWRGEGYARLAQEIERQVHPDGVHWEMSAGYHVMSGNGFATPFELAQVNGIEVPAGYTARLRKMFDHVWQLQRPDGTLPSHNDSGGIDGRHLSWVGHGARLFGDSTMAWMASEGKEGSPPGITSAAFLDSGLIAMRSGWQRDDKWCFFDAGPIGRGHDHEDSLGFELYAGGTLFLCDPGIATYFPESWTAHYKDTAAHNTIMLDGCPHDERRESMVERVRSVRDEIYWQTGDVADVARARYTSGFRGLPGRYVHERTVVFVRPDYWLLFDELWGEEEGDGAPHTLESLFHFTPLRLQIEGERVRTYRENLPNLELIPLAPARRERLEIVCGQHDPVQGWAVVGGSRGARGERESVPAPCLIRRRRGKLPYRSALALYPYTGRVNAGLDVRRVKSSARELTVELTHLDGRRDVVALEWSAGAGDHDRLGRTVRKLGSGNLQLGPYRTSGWFGIARGCGDTITTHMTAGEPQP